MTTKHERIVRLLDKNNLDGLIIQQIANFAWATDGAASYINTAATNGVGTLLITKDARHLIADNIETPRFKEEEQLENLGWECHSHRWDTPSKTLERLTSGLKLGVDALYPGTIDLSKELAVLRSYLDKSEQDRFISLSSLCAEAMDEAVRAIQPGQSEFQIAALLSGAAQKRGVLPIVNLIATDERIYKFRHPLPTTKKMDKYAMLVLCGRAGGLVCSLTRLIHFGQLPDELKMKANGVAYIDAAMIAASRPGRTVADIFQITKEAYKKVGFADEWQFHHQGGPAGYDPREFLATAAEDIPVGIGQTYAWNPSITGCKSEDTILVGETRNEILSSVEGWPTLKVDIEGQIIKRPAILVVE
ncbi:M24 family metallopeptidase [Chloroflexota bacterium]